MKTCKNCGKEIPTSRPKWCSKECCTRNYQKNNRELINERAKQKRLTDLDADRKRRALAMRKWRASHREHSLAYYRARQKTGETSSEDKVLFYGYKDPLRKFEGGFGYVGVLRYSKDQDKVECHLCGRLFRMLNNGHLGKVHGITAREYKAQTGLTISTALLGEGTRIKLLDRGHNPNHIAELKKAHKRREERKKAGLPDLQSGQNVLTPQRMNQRGTCPDQLLNMIDKTAKSLGRAPTTEEFLAVHNGKFLGSIRRTFGTWTNALAKLELRTHHIGFTDEHLIEQVKNFYQVNKRTPRYSDFERGLLPTAGVYYRRYKSLNNVRLLANVPLVIPVGKWKRQEWMPSKDERTKMLAQL